MTISDINTYVTSRTGADTTAYSAANRLISTNRWYHKVTDMIFDSLLNYSHDDLNVSTEAIVSKNTVSNQEYVALGVSDEILSIQRVEVSYDGTNYYKAEPISQRQIPTSIVNQDVINNEFSTTKPYYEHKGQLLYLYPVPTSSVTNGLKLWVQREADEYTSAQVTTGTKEPGFDKPWHIMIALGMCWDWFVSKKLWNEAKTVADEILDYEIRLRKAYGRKNSDVMRFGAGYINYE